MDRSIGADSDRPEKAASWGCPGSRHRHDHSVFSFTMLMPRKTVPPQAVSELIDDVDRAINRLPDAEHVWRARLIRLRSALACQARGRPLEPARARRSARPSGA